MQLRTLFHFPAQLQPHRAVWGEGGFEHHSHPLMVPTGPNKGPQEKIRPWSLSDQCFGSFGNYRGSLHPREPVCFLFSSHLKVIRIFFHLGGFYPLLTLKASGNYKASFPTDAFSASGTPTQLLICPPYILQACRIQKKRGRIRMALLACGMPSSKARLVFAAWLGAPKPMGVLPGKRSRQETPKDGRRKDPARWSGGERG